MSDTSTREDRIAAGCLQVFVFGFFALVILFMVLPSGDRGGSTSQSPDITWNTYDITIDVREDGSMHVTESQEIAFRGTFSAGFAEIPMERIESIDNVAVTVEAGVPRDPDGPTFIASDQEEEGDLVEARQVSWNAFNDEPNTYRARQDGGLYLIDYAFDPTARWLLSGEYANNTRTVIIEYDVHGVIRDYPDVAEPWQQFHWMAISSEVTAIAPIRSASITVNLPEVVSGEDLVVAPEAASNDGQTITWTRTGLGEGEDFDVQAAFPAITGATSPSWQDAADARDASIEAREQRQNAGQLMLILAGVAIVVLGGLAILYAWYRGIREPAIGPVHQEIADPPGDMPAVLVGSLLDEEVHPRDIAAGVLDLHHQGLLTIRNGDESETERYYLTLNRRIPFRPAWTREMLNAIFGQDAREGTEKGFSALRDLFGVHRQVLQQAIDQSLVDDGYYEELPETSRKHWTWVTYGFAIAGVLAAIAILVWVRGWSGWAILPVIAGVALWWFGRKLTPHVAQKTRRGAETAALWRAFQRHLVATQYQVSKDTQARRRAEYGPWITAFGMEQGWLSEMNRPAWDASRSPAQTTGSTATWIWGESHESSRGSSTSVPPSDRSRGTTLEPPGWRPIGGGWDAGSWRDMQSASNSFGDTISSASDGAFSMIGDMLEALGSSSGGSGGSSGGGSSFRGSSSRSGGGRSSSSSGGGSRGFR